MLSDQPITGAKDDLLGRAPFARQIASAMLASPAGKKGSFVIGLCGGWGSGKTSVLNMTVEALRKKGADNPVVVRFNPWQYPAEELLPGQFLLTLAAELQKPAHGKKLNKAGRAMEKYTASFLPCPPGIRTETVAELRGEPLKPSQKNGLPPGVSNRKEKVAELLRNQKRRICVVVDDIDRLSSPRICQALQLVKAVADFPRMVYLLSFDQDVVVGALNRELNGQGLQYLKKFMQVQFIVPAPDSGKIRDILTAYFDAWLQSQPGLNFDRAYFADVAPFLFQCAASIRDVYRLVNTFRVRYQALGNEVNFVDLFALTALQLQIPRALPWIQAHRDDLLRGGGLAFQGANPQRRQVLKEEHRRMLAALGGDGAKTLIPLIGRMFPSYGKNVLDIVQDDFDPRMVRMRRICCEEFFDLYFTQTADALAITQREIFETIHRADAVSLREYTDGLTQEARRSAFIDQLPHYLDDIPDGKLPTFFYEALWLSRLPEDKTPADTPRQRSFFHACCYCALRVLAQMRGDTRLQTLREAVARADKHTVPILVALLTRIRDGNPDAESVDTDGDAAKALLRQLMNKIHAIALDGNWLLSHQPLPVLEYWKQADAVSFRVYFQTLMRDDGNAARLISCLTQRFDHGANMEYQYGDIGGAHAFADDFPPEDARAALRRLRGTGAFRALPGDVRLDCVAFSLTDADFGRVAHQAVLEAYPAWMKEE